MVEKTLRSVIRAEHEMEHLAESAQSGSQDATEKELQQIRHNVEQAALSAVRISEAWGKDALHKPKEHKEEIEL